MKGVLSLPVAVAVHARRGPSPAGCRQSRQQLTSCVEGPSSQMPLSTQLTCTAPGRRLRGQRVTREKTRGLVRGQCPKLLDPPCNRDTRTSDVC